MSNPLCDAFDVTTTGEMTATSQGISSGSRSRRRWIVLLVAGATVAAVAFWAVNRWNSPTVFRDGDAGSFSADARVLSDFPLYVGFGHAGPDSSETLTVDSADVLFSENSAGFTATVLVCDQRPVAEGTLTLGTAFAGDQRLEDYCTDVRPLQEGTSLRLERGSGQYLIAALTPAGAGSARVKAIDIQYSRTVRHFFQRGTQRVTQDFTIAAAG